MDNTQLLHARIDALLALRPRAAVAIDGMAASGKSTLAAALCARIPASAVVHMDDFTLPLDMRRPGYFDETLANVDLLRFDQEVLSPFLAGQAVRYRPYACHPVPGYLAPVFVPAHTRLLIVEGAYCLHPALFNRYDLRVLYTIDADTQRARILARNGAAQLARFESMWIPMENKHIAARDLPAACDLVLSGA